MDFLKNIKEQEKNIRDNVQKKIAKGDVLTDAELKAYTLTDEDIEVLDLLTRVTDGENVPGFEIMDFLASPQAKILIPKVLIGQARKSADGVYLASKFFKKIKLKNGQAVMFPDFGVMRAYDVAEGQEINFGVSAA